MASYQNVKEWIKAIANAIRAKEGTEEKILHQDFPARILAIQTQSYSWAKYIAAPDGGYEIGYEESESTTLSYSSPASRILYQTMEFDASTGVVTLSNPLSDTASTAAEQLANYQEYPYFYGDLADGSSDATVYMISKMTQGAKNYLGWQSWSWTFQKIVLLCDAYLKGDYVGNVYSSTGDTYPENGYQDGYWYELLTSGETSGGSSDGIDTSDATATAEDVANGKTAYVNGKKITGTVKTVESGSTIGWTGRTPVYLESNGRIGFTQKVNEANYSGILWRNGSNVMMYADSSAFGDATAEDVVEGKTFTSASGVKITGTRKESSDGDSAANSGNTGTTTTTYTWEKYEAVESAGYVITYETGVEITDTQTTTRVLYKTITVDNATGEMVLSDALKESGSYGSQIVSNYETYPYIYIDGVVYKITSYASKGTYQGYGGTTELATAKAQSSGVFTQGDYIGTATSSSPDTYPDNGYQDGYWYVKK